MDKGSRIKDEIKGLLAIIAGLVVAISIVSHKKFDESILTYSSKLDNLLGSFGANLSDILLQSIGFSAYIIPVIFFFYGLKKIFGKSAETRLPIYIGAAVMLIFSASSLITLIFGDPSGGTVGFYSTGLTLKIFSTTGSYLLLITLLLISIMYLFNFSIAAFIKNIRKNISYSSQAISTLSAKRREVRRETRQRHIEMEEADESEGEAEPVYEQEPLPLTYPEIRTKPKETRSAKPLKKISGDYELPGIELLKDPSPSKSRPSKEELIERSDMLENKLLDYSIEGKVTYVSPGPIVTMFEFEKRTHTLTRKLY